MPFCYKCGKSINEQAKFCSYCGFKISEEVTARLTGKKKVTEEPEESFPHKGKKKDIKINVDVFGDAPKESMQNVEKKEEPQHQTHHETAAPGEEESFGWVWIIIAIIVLIIIGIIVWAVVSGTLVLPGA